MGRAPCCDKASVKKGPWSPEEDRKLKEYIHKFGTGGNWIALPHKAGLKRCGKSCRLRWLNYLRPNIKHGDFSEDEDQIICSLFATIGSRWSIIAAQLPGRTDNDIKNYWNTKLKKKLMHAHGLQPPTNRYRHRSKKQQHVFFSAETPSSPPPVPGDPLSLQYLSTPVHNFSHHYSSHGYENTSMSLLSAGGSGGILMCGDNGEQPMMSSSSCAGNDRDGLGLYLEFCNNGNSHGHDGAVAAGLAMESFIMQEDHHNKEPLLLARAANLDHQYSANTSCGYEETKPAGGGCNNGAGDCFFYSWEKRFSPNAASVSQQAGSFIMH